MGACKSCSRVVLVLINILFSLIGLAMLIVGSIVRWGTDVMNQYLADIYNEFNKTLQEHGDVDISEFNIADLISDVTLSFIVIGAFFFVIGILGCVGACCTVRPMLILYIIILVVLLAAEIAFVVVLFAAQNQVDKWLKKPFKDTLKDYTGIDGKDAVTLGLNFIMTRYDCCGVEGYQDFNETSTNWNRTYYDTSDGVYRQKKLPAVCCIELNNTECFQNPNSNNSHFEQGCYDAVKDWLNDNMVPLIGTSAGVLAVELLLVIFACVACAKSRKDDDDDYPDDYDGKPVMDDRSYDAIRAYDQQGYHGPHHNRHQYGGHPNDNRQSYRGGPNDNGGYQRSEYDRPQNRRDRRY